MIFPFLKGLVNPRLAPVTYLLIALNLFVFLFTVEAFLKADRGLDALLEDEDFLSTQGTAFAVMVVNEPSRFSPTLRSLAGEALDGESDARRVLGGLALRNNDFMSRASTYDFGGDQIAIESWRTKFDELIQLQDEHPSYQWGLTDRTDTWEHWFSYQFAHSGWAHLFWNMIFLVIFGAFVEQRLGGRVVLFTYLTGGLLGAGSFAALSGISSSPLIGASAAVSGLMGLVTVAFWREKLTFFYWLLPFRGYFGFALLPTWLVAIVFMMPDLSGFLSAVPELGSIAYSAHLGGIAAGAAIAGLLMSLGRVPKAEPSGATVEPFKLDKTA